jgi:NAD(P)H-quinone oxidoreductase subunit 4
MWPVHTWLPDAHVEAPTGGSIILAAVLLKMGGYGLLRFSLPISPEGSMTLAPLMITLSLIAIIYIGLVAIAQTDMKKLIAYSSISHMGFVLIGIASYTSIGLSGAMLQMISHGLIGASLFFMVGATYDRTHTLMLDEMGGIGNKMKKMFAMWTTCSMASLALPGMSGFAAELMIFIGFATSDAYNSIFKIVVIILAAVGVILKIEL